MGEEGVHLGRPGCANLSLNASPPSPCRCPQSILTGESHSVDKQLWPVTQQAAVVQDKTDILFSVRIVRGGREGGLQAGGLRPPCVRGPRAAAAAAATVVVGV